MPKIYLLLVHKSPEQLERQINALNDGDSLFYIHLDLKSDISHFSHIEDMEKVYFIKERIDCIWGDFSIIKATLNLIENVIKNNDKGYCILLSGNDYPIKSRQFINTFIAENKDKIFINLRDAFQVWNTFNLRIDYYRINLSSRRGHFVLLKGFSLNAVKRLIKGNLDIKTFYKIIFKKRKLKIPMKFYGGSQWWAMNINQLNEIYNFINNNRIDLYEFFKFSNIPDEFFFQSIIKYLFESRNDIINEESLTYVNWTRKNCDLPVTFRINDYTELYNQPTNKLFARKFDIELDKEILDKLDKEIV